MILRMIACIVRVCAFALFVTVAAPAHAVFINEIHYDNSGADSGEAVELAGAAGVDLSGWSLVFYNGNDGNPYKTKALSGSFADMQGGFGVLSFAVSGIQNGASDGIALVNAASMVEQFLSYEGTLLANSGVAAGMSSEDIGVAESDPVPSTGYSLQLAGAGSAYADFVWQQATTNSFGAINTQQAFLPLPTERSLPSVSTSVPEPAGVFLMLAGLLGLVSGRWGIRVSWRRAGYDAPRPA